MTNYISDHTVHAYDVYAVLGHLVYSLSNGCVLRAIFTNPPDADAEAVLVQASDYFKAHFLTALEQELRELERACPNDIIVSY